MVTVPYDESVKFRTSATVTFWSPSAEDADGWVDEIKRMAAGINPEATVQATIEYMPDGRPQSINPNEPGGSPPPEPPVEPIEAADDSPTVEQEQPTEEAPPTT